MAVSEAQIIGLHADEVDVAEQAIAALSDDLRFEHLDHPMTRCGNPLTSFEAALSLPLESIAFTMK